MDALTYTEHQYGSQNDLQNLGVWEFPDTAPADATGKTKYWIIYLHGGAWRDPRVDLTTALPTFTRLLDPSTASPHLPASRLAGLASLNYRLSPHPAFPQPPATTPPRNARTARHPDHLLDVRAGLAFLQARFAFGENYLLAGHSAGAFLAFQLLMRGAAVAEGEGEGGGAVLPAAVVGVEGIYDLRGINARAGGALGEIFEGAFGPDTGPHGVWDAASPARFRGFRDTWGPEGRLAVLAHSPEDELVDAGEIDAMEEALRKSRVPTLAFRDLTARHDEVREDGRGILRVLGEAVKVLDELDQAGRPP